MGRKKAKRGRRLWSVQDKHVRGIIEVNTKQFHHIYLVDFTDVSFLCFFSCLKIGSVCIIFLKNMLKLLF